MLGVKVEIAWEIVDLGTESSLIKHQRKLQDGNGWNQLFIKLKFTNPSAVSPDREQDQIKVNIQEDFFDEMLIINRNRIIQLKP